MLYLAFWMSHAVADNAQNWAEMDNATRAAIQSDLRAGGVRLMVSAFGATEQPTTAGDDPVATAQALAQWVKEQGLDGVDCDFEDLQARALVVGEAADAAPAPAAAPNGTAYAPTSNYVSAMLRIRVR